MTSISYLAPANHEFVGSCIARERLDRSLRALHQVSLESVLLGTANVLNPATAMAEVRTATHAASELPSSPDSVLDADAFDRGVEDALIGAVCSALTVDMAPWPSTLAARNHWRCVRVVRQYMEDHLGHDLRLETLCRVGRVSARSLERAFHEVADCSPRQFIKARRLNAARHALVESGPEDTSVKAVAIDCGFPGKGWFVYFRIYGPEAPAFDGSWKPGEFEKVQ